MTLCYQRLVKRQWQTVKIIRTLIELEKLRISINCKETRVRAMGAILVSLMLILNKCLLKAERYLVHSQTFIRSLFGKNSLLLKATNYFRE